MKKKAYLIPETTVFAVAPHLMDNFSGESTTQGDPDVSGTPDDSNDPNRSRNPHNVWDDEEEEDY